MQGGRGLAAGLLSEPPLVVSLCVTNCAHPFPFASDPPLPGVTEPPPRSRIALAAADVMSTAHFYILAKPSQFDQVLKEQDWTATRQLSVARAKAEAKPT
jgi:hypothetical protein